jgi:hypothetical protein
MSIPHDLHAKWRMTGFSDRWRRLSDEVPAKGAASSMVQAFPGPQYVVGVRRWRVRCGLPTIRPESTIDGWEIINS